MRKVLIFASTIVLVSGAASAQAPAPPPTVPTQFVLEGDKDHPAVRVTIYQVG